RRRRWGWRIGSWSFSFVLMIYICHIYRRSSMAFHHILLTIPADDRQAGFAEDFSVAHRADVGRPLDDWTNVEALYPFGVFNDAADEHFVVFVVGAPGDCGWRVFPGFG